LALDTALTFLSIVQSVATLVLIPVVKFILDTKVQIEKERIMIELILQDLKEIKEKIKELDDAV
jgi:tetrahydromethanopterin S-methyltransferase subunit B